MKGIMLALVMASALGASGAGVASAGLHGPITAVVDINYFASALEPYGFWVTIEPYGFVWVPADVSADWRPYSDGYWTYTDYGWTWVDNAEWGWAPFHYGRWAFDDLYGWVWVPDTVWGPAWVAWRLGNGIVGWAPLPPGAHWRIGVGFVSDGWRFGTGIYLGGWCFVQDRHFLRHHLRRHFLGHDRAEHHFRNSRDVTDYGYLQGRIVDRSLAVRDIERRTGQRVRQRVIVDRGPQEPAGRTIERGNVVRVYRPNFRSTDDARVMRAPAHYRVVKPKRQIDEEQQLRVRHEEERAQLEQRYQQATNRTAARRAPQDEAKVQKERTRLNERQQQERRQLEQRQARERRSERTRQR